MARTRKDFVSGQELSELKTYCEVVRYLLRHEGAAITQAKQELPLEASVSTVTRMLRRLEEDQGVALVELRSSKPFTVVTPAGRQFYEAGRALLAAQEAFGRARASPPRVVVGINSFFMSHVLPGRVMAECMSALMDRVDFAENTDDLVEDVRRGRIDFAIDGRRELGAEDSVFCAPLRKDGREIELDCVLVCHPDHHPIADRIRKNEPLGLNDLAGVTVCVMPDYRQYCPPLPAPTEGGGRIPLTSSPAAVAWARMSSAVGIVPAIYDWLDELRKQGLLLYCRLQEAVKSTPCVYLRKAPPGDSGQHVDPREAALGLLSVDARVLFAAIERRFGQLPVLPAYPFRDETGGNLPSPSTYDSFQHVYFVSRTEEPPSDARPRATPCWFSMRLERVKAEPHAARGGRGGKGGTPGPGPGEQFEYSRYMRVPKEGNSRRKRGHNPRPTEYLVVGELVGQNIFVLKGESLDRSESEGFVAAFNTYYRHPLSDPQHECLLGFWTGVDGYKFQTTGPIILSAKELSLDDLRHLTRTAAYNVLPGAEDQWPGWKNVESDSDP